MSHLSYEESKSRALKIILVLAAMTLLEVVFALMAKGYIIEGFHLSPILVGAVMIIMSLVKAYLIVYEFMHMKYEVPGLVKSVLLPMFLLVWAVIAFFSEGNYWKNNRQGIEDKDAIEVDTKKIIPSGYLEDTHTELIDRM